MFNRELKDEIKDLKNEVSSLKEKLNAIPEIKICPECNQLKTKSNFFDSERYFNAGTYSRMSGTFYNNYCSDCAPKMKLKEEAKKIAESNPEMVIACNKKKGKK